MKKLEEYLVTRIREFYKSFDRAHDERHFDEVFYECKKLTKELFKQNPGVYNEETTMDVMLISAAYHDMGRLVNDETHEELSLPILERDRLVHKILEEKYSRDDARDIITNAKFIILSHRSKVLTDDELCLILKDADKVSMQSKERALYRVCAFFIDRLMFDNTLEEMVEERYDFLLKGKNRHKPKSATARKLYNDKEIKYTFDKDEIRAMLESLL